METPTFFTPSRGSNSSCRFFHIQSNMTITAKSAKDIGDGEPKEFSFPRILGTEPLRVRVLCYWCGMFLLRQTKVFSFVHMANVFQVLWLSFHKCGYSQIIHSNPSSSRKVPPWAGTPLDVVIIASAARLGHSDLVRSFDFKAQFFGQWRCLWTAALLEDFQCTAFTWVCEPKSVPRKCGIPSQRKVKEKACVVQISRTPRESIAGERVSQSKR